MAAQGGVLTANTVEMLLLAWALNDKQTFFEISATNSRGTVITHAPSSAIRSGFGLPTP
jgi:hypothetical protein